MTLGDDDDDDREDDAIPPPRPRTPRPFPPRTRARRPSVSDARRLFARRRRTLAGRMGTTSSAPARDSRGDLRQRAAQQAQQPRYTMPQGYANAPQPFQGQQNYAAPRYYGQVRAHPPAVPPENPPRASRRSRVTQTRHSLVLFLVAASGCPGVRQSSGNARKIFLVDATSVKRADPSLSSLSSFRRKKNVSVFPTDRVTNVHHRLVHARMNTRTYIASPSTSASRSGGAHDAHDDDSQPREFKKRFARARAGREIELVAL